MAAWSLSDTEWDALDQPRFVRQTLWCSVHLGKKPEIIANPASAERQSKGGRTGSKPGVLSALHFVRNARRGVVINSNVTLTYFGGALSSALVAI